jgi:hypothetical protein
MMKAIAALFFLTFSSSPVFAEQTVENPSSHYVQPCQYWNYNPNAQGYVCQNVGSSIQIMDAYEVERYISNLQRQIDNLERRLSALESSK